MGDREDQHFGHQPAEQVFGRSVSRPPSTRIRVASVAHTGVLKFEPEVGSQKDELAALFTPGPVPRANLTFEPEEGETADRVARAESERAPAAASAQNDIDELVRLAAAGDDQPASSQPVPEDTGFERPDLHGDLEAEIFGPGAAASKPAPATDDDAISSGARTVVGQPTPSRTVVLDEGEQTARSGTATPATGNWISVFLSERVAGRKKRRRSTVFRRSTAVVGGTAGRVFGGLAARVRSLHALLDSFTSRCRLPMKSIEASLLIIAVAIIFGVSWTLGGIFLAVCLALTVAGQPVRNLFGFAGVIIMAAAFAEIIRQRERFLEIVWDLFG